MKNKIGQFSEFTNNVAAINVKIKECDETEYIYQDKDKDDVESIKSW